MRRSFVALLAVVAFVSPGIASVDPVGHLVKWEPLAISRCGPLSIYYWKRPTKFGGSIFRVRAVMNGQLVFSARFTHYEVIVAQLRVADQWVPVAHMKHYAMPQEIFDLISWQVSDQLFTEAQCENMVFRSQ